MVNTFSAFRVTGKEQKEKHTQAITKTLEEAVSCASTPGAPLSPPGFSSRSITGYFQRTEQQVVWNGRPEDKEEEEEEGTEGCFRSVHAKGNCASIQFTNNAVNRSCCTTSCVTVVSIWDSSFSVPAVGAVSGIGDLAGSFVQARAVGWEYGVNDVILE